MGCRHIERILSLVVMGLLVVQPVQAQVNISFNEPQIIAPMGFSVTVDVDQIGCYYGAMSNWLAYLNPSAIRLLIPPTSNWTEFVGDGFGRSFENDKVASEEQWTTAVARLRNASVKKGDAPILTWMTEKDPAGNWSKLNESLTNGRTIQTEELPLVLLDAFSSSSGVIGLDPSGDSSSPITYNGKTEFVLTWYSYQDNTPRNSDKSASGKTLVPFVSAALPFRFLKPWGGPVEFGDTVFVPFLEGRRMPDSSRHTGWVRIDDICGDNGDDGYCFKKLKDVGDVELPSLDLYVGDVYQSGMIGNKNGPAGNGMELIEVLMGGTAEVKFNYVAKAVNPIEETVDDDENTSENDSSSSTQPAPEPTKQSDAAPVPKSDDSINQNDKAPAEDDQTPAKDDKAPAKDDQTPAPDAADGNEEAIDEKNTDVAEGKSPSPDIKSDDSPSGALDDENTTVEEKKSPSPDTQIDYADDQIENSEDAAVVDGGTEGNQTEDNINAIAEDGQSGNDGNSTVPLEDYVGAIDSSEESSETDDTDGENVNEVLDPEADGITTDSNISMSDPGLTDGLSRQASRKMLQFPSKLDATFRRRLGARQLLAKPSESELICPGAPLETLISLYQRNLTIMGIWDVPCGSILSKNDVPSSSSYWARRWELYRAFYIGGRFFAHMEVPQLELLTSIEACPSDEVLRDEILVRSLALQHAYSDHALWMGPIGVVSPLILAPNLPTKNLTDLRNIKFPKTTKKDEDWMNFGNSTTAKVFQDDACDSNSDKIETFDSANAVPCYAKKLAASINETGWFSLEDLVTTSDNTVDQKPWVSMLLATNTSSTQNVPSPQVPRIIGSTKTSEAWRLLLAHTAGQQEFFNITAKPMVENLTLYAIGDSMSYHIYSANSATVPQKINIDLSSLEDIPAKTPAIVHAVDEDYHGEVIDLTRISANDQLSLTQSASSLYMMSLPKVRVTDIDARRTTNEAVIYATEPPSSASTEGGLIVRLSKSASKTSVVLLDFSSVVVDPYLLVSGILEMSVVSVPADAPRQLTVLALPVSWSPSQVGWSSFGDLLRSPDGLTGWGADYINWTNAEVLGHLTASREAQRLRLDVTEFLRKGRVPSFMLVQLSRRGESFAGPIEIANSRASKSWTPRLRLYKREAPEGYEPGALTFGTYLTPGRPLPLPAKEAGNNAVWNMDYFSAGQGASVTNKDDSLLVKYPKGKVGGDHGVHFRANPFGLLPARSCVLSYSVYVPANHSFVKSGKMHGVCLGEKPTDCASGKTWSATKGSVRVVWESSGALRAYLYVPAENSAVGAENIGDNYAVVRKDAGITLFSQNDDLKLIRGGWNTVSLGVDLGSTAPIADGVVTLTVNGLTKTAKGMDLRPYPSVMIQSMRFATFYGGSTNDFAPSTDQYLAFKDFRFSASGI